MAERRMIHKKISRSEQFADMTEFAQLFFVMMIPHADDWGAIKGTPRVMKATVMPLNENRSVEDVADALDEMEAARLIWRYEPDDDGPALQFRKWEEHQTGLTKRTAPSQKLYHYPPDARESLEKKGVSRDYEEFQGDSKNFQELPGTSVRTEQNRKEEKGTKPKKGTRKRDPRLDHKAIIGYKELARLHVPIALRDDWIACSEEVGIEHLLAIVKEWLGKGYKPQNVAGMMNVAREGWAYGKNQRRDRQDTGADDYLRKAGRGEG